MNLGYLKPSRWTWFSPWVILGMVCILAGILLFLAIKNIHREKGFMEKALLSQATILMRSLEASTRTGMAGTGWSAPQIQLLVEETSQQPDVLYMAIVDSGGKVLARSDPRLVGTRLQKGLHSCRELIDRTLQLVEKDGLCALTKDALHRQVKIESSIDPEDLPVEVDPDRFAQILLNLYLNALQAMEKGGTLRIEAFRQGERTVFAVSDSGTGILPEHLPNIFDPYFTTKPGGVGLGLANVHKLVEAHGGEIEVESSPEQGTSFTIRIPYAL